MTRTLRIVPLLWSGTLLLGVVGGAALGLAQAPTTPDTAVQQAALADLAAARLTVHSHSSLYGIGATEDAVVVVPPPGSRVPAEPGADLLGWLRRMTRMTGWAATPGGYQWSGLVGTLPGVRLPAPQNPIVRRRLAELRITVRVQLHGGRVARLTTIEPSWTLVFTVHP